jgi:hypothetical protein
MAEVGAGAGALIFVVGFVALMGLFMGALNGGRSELETHQAAVYVAGNFTGSGISANANWWDWIVGVPNSIGWFLGTIASTLAYSSGIPLFNIIFFSVGIVVILILLVLFRG